MAACKRRLGQGTVFTPVCSRGGRGSLYDVISFLVAWSHVPSEGGLCLWSHVPSGVICLPRGVYVQGVSLTETPLDRDPPHGKERVVYILLECILVASCEWIIKGSTN